MLLTRETTDVGTKRTDFNRENRFRDWRLPKRNKAVKMTYEKKKPSQSASSESLVWTQGRADGRGPLPHAGGVFTGKVGVKRGVARSTPPDDDGEGRMKSLWGRIGARQLAGGPTLHIQDRNIRENRKTIRFTTKITVGKDTSHDKLCKSWICPNPSPSYFGFFRVLSGRIFS